MTDNWRYPLYDLEYYTGSQVSIYIGNVLVDEVESLAFSLRQNKTPVYGYASKLFDAVIPGNVLVQGQFTVNFIDSGYLFAILVRAANPELENAELQALKDIFDGKIPEAQQEIVTSVTSAATGVGGSLTPVGGGTNILGQDTRSAPIPITTNNPIPENPSRIADALIQGGVINKANKRDIALALSKAEAERMTDEPFRRTGLTSQKSKVTQVNEALTRKIWGNIAGTEAEINTEKGQIFRADDLNNKFGTFDLHITYGFKTTFDGNTGQETIIRSPSFAYKKITNIHILGSTQEIDSNTGNPIKETYTFLAREMI